MSNEPRHFFDLKTLSLIFAFIALLTFSSSAFSTPNSATPETQARRQFLFDLGFDDVPAAIRARLERKEYQHELNRRQMEANIIAYEVLNASRELSLFIMSEAGVDGPQIRSTKAEQLGLFAARLLALKPLAPSTDYPSHITEIKEEGARELALIDWLRAERTYQMNLHKNRILSDIVSLLYGKDIDRNTDKIQKMDKLLTTIVERMYLDDTIGNGKYFGRALAALLLREEKLHGNDLTQVRRLMSRELKSRHNLYLENFFGDTMVIPTAAGEQRFKVENGTMMLTRNLSAGSLQISWAAIPENLAARWKARFKGIIGTPLAAPLFVTPEDTKDGLGLLMRIRDRIAQGGILRMGFSHIVFYEIKEDPITGIKMPRVIDNYPNRVFDSTNEYVRTGGTRFTYPEQVIDMSHHAAVYFSNPIPEKVQDWSQRNLIENGYQSEFFPSTELELKDGIIPIKSQKIVNWKTTISESEFARLHSEQDAKKLSREIWKRFVNGLEQTVYEGWTFHWPDPYDFYLVAATYCSQLGDMVMRRFVGMPLEQSKSVWHWALRFFANIGKVAQQLKRVPGLEKVGESLLKLPNVEKSMKLTEIDIISPTSLVLQPYMQGKSFKFGSRTPEQRAQSAYMTDGYRELDPELTRHIEEKIKLNRFRPEPRNYVLDYGAAMRDFEYGVVMRATRGLKTPGFSSEKMAELAVERQAPKLKTAMAKVRCVELFK